MDQQKSSTPHGAPAGAPGAAQDELARLRRQHAELLLALQPFAAAFEQVKDGSRDPDPDIQAFLDRNTITPSVMMGDFRRAYDAVHSAADSAPASAPKAGVEAMSDTELDRLSDAFQAEADADGDTQLRAGGTKRLIAFDYYKRGYLFAKAPAANAGGLAAPEDWKLVPIEPTGTMKDAGAFGGLPVELSSQTWTAASVYRAMVASAPAVPAAIPAPTANAGEVQPPLDMILHCPACGLQHVDAPDRRTPEWKNEPHRSHLCHGCGHIWRPADEPTNGVAAIKTKGKADSPAPNRAPAADAVGLDAPLYSTRLKAARYEWLRERMCFDKPAGQPVTMTLRAPIYAPDHDVHKDWVSDRFLASVDRTIDAAMQADSQAVDAGGDQ